MTTSQEKQINQLKQAIADLESQRGILGDEAVDAALIPSQQKLAELQGLVADSIVELPGTTRRQRKFVQLLYIDVVDSTAMTRFRAPKIKRFHIRSQLKPARLNLAEEKRS